MKVLVVHNEYASALPSGENVAVSQQVLALREAGVEVVPCVRSSDEVGTAGGPSSVRAAASALGLGVAHREIVQVLREERPDVVHLHNPYPLISAQVISDAHSAGVPVVQTVHNFRHECVVGTFFRDGHRCTDCLGHVTSYPGIVHRCYRGSRGQSAVMTTAQATQRRLFRRLDGAIALTPALVEHLAGYGIARDRISVVPNSVPDPGFTAAPGAGILFAGRLSAEKGLPLLAEAWSSLPPGAAGTLTIAGDGPDRPIVEALVASRSDVRYVGPVPAEDVGALVRAAAAVVVPSIWDEVCPLIVLEALAHGRPVVATDRGGLPFLIGADGGWIVPAEGAALSAGLVEAAGGIEQAAAVAAARARYLREFAPSVILDQLIEVYEAALARRRNQRLNRN